MQIGFALFALMTLVLSPAMAVEETMEVPAPELAPSINDFAVSVSVPPQAEAAAPQPENTTSRADIDLPYQELEKDQLISVGPDGFPGGSQPN